MRPLGRVPLSVPTIAEDGSGAHDGVVVVHVEDRVSPALAVHQGIAYQSPPLHRAEALALVRVLIGHDDHASEELCWRCAIAGGRRTVRLESAASDAIGANAGRRSNGSLG
jgi:hypothetical protein